MADFLDEKRSEIGARLKELKPLVDEYQRLEAAAAALDGVPTSSAPRAAASHTRAPRTRAGRAQARQEQRRRTSRPAQGHGHARRRGARARPLQARHHDPGDRRADGHQAELPVPRPAWPGRGRPRQEGRPRLAPEGSRVATTTRARFEVLGRRPEPDTVSCERLRRGRAPSPPRARRPAPSPSRRACPARTRRPPGPARSRTRRP